MSTGWYSWERALTIMSLGKVNLGAVITNRIRLEDWEKAFERLEKKQEIKVIIYPNEKYMPK